MSWTGPRYLSAEKEIKLVVLVEKDEALLNYISLIPVNPKKFPRVNHEDTMTFVKWLTDPDKGQQVIADFGKDKYGAPSSSPIRGSGRPRRRKRTVAKRRTAEKDIENELKGVTI